MERTEDHDHCRDRAQLRLTSQFGIMPRGVHQSQFPDLKLGCCQNPELQLGCLPMNPHMAPIDQKIVQMGFHNL
ncbi:hypothetical protein NC653_007115 [Populus alba x Populus x berolinensis]|uniref:Uncharacterized protein n=1 Tax=Populus alba x Populus x berolinensis TaxID=444605 RepID=A0AAD6RGJ5_9ROSI|nr:hypothetical protein NC653_007115 [Populus alba x Populus x berolinensis]